MTIRRELISTIIKKLSELSYLNKTNEQGEIIRPLKKLELIDLDRGQMQNPEKSFGTIYTSALISIGSIKWDSMTNQQLEGTAVLTINLYIKDGFTNQHFTTKDELGGMYEIDLIDEVIQSLEFLKGDHFKPLELINEGEIPYPYQGIMGYSLSFQTHVYRQLKKKFVYKTY